MAEQTTPSAQAECADCGKPIHRTAPGVEYNWGHNLIADLLACPGVQRTTRPAEYPTRGELKCAARIATDPAPCGCLIEQVAGEWRHVYRKVDTLHAAVPQ